MEPFTLSRIVIKTGFARGRNAVAGATPQEPPRAFSMPAANHFKKGKPYVCNAHLLGRKYQKSADAMPAFSPNYPGTFDFAWEPVCSHCGPGPLSSNQAGKFSRH